MWRNYGRALPYEKRYWQLKTIYPKCIKAERYWNLQRIKVCKIYKKARNMYINYRKLHKIAGNKCVNVCNNHKNENYHEQLQRLATYYKKCKKNIGPLLKKVKQAKKNVYSSVQKSRPSSRKIHCDEKKMHEDRVPDECQKMSISVQACLRLQRVWEMLEDC